MKFWGGNRLNCEFDWPVQAVADTFLVWWLKQSEEYQNYIPLERALRSWLTDSAEFNASWEAEHGPESFDELYEIARDMTREAKSLWLRQSSA